MERKICKGLKCNIPIKCNSEGVKKGEVGLYVPKAIPSKEIK